MHLSSCTWHTGVPALWGRVFIGRKVELLQYVRSLNWKLFPFFREVVQGHTPALGTLWKWFLHKDWWCAATWCLRPHTSALECAGQLHVQMRYQCNLYTQSFPPVLNVLRIYSICLNKLIKKICPLTVHGNLALVARTGEVGNFPDIGIHCKKNENAVRDTVDDTFLLLSSWIALS